MSRKLFYPIILCVVFLPQISIGQGFDDYGQNAIFQEVPRLIRQGRFDEAERLAVRTMDANRNGPVPTISVVGFAVEPSSLLRLHGQHERVIRVLENERKHLNGQRPSGDHRDLSRKMTIQQIEFELANTYIEAGRLADARNSINSAKRINPFDTDVLGNSALMAISTESRSVLNELFLVARENNRTEFSRLRKRMYELGQQSIAEVKKEQAKWKNNTSNQFPQLESLSDIDADKMFNSFLPGAIALCDASNARIGFDDSITAICERSFKLGASRKINSEKGLTVQNYLQGSYLLSSAGSGHHAFSYSLTNSADGPMLLNNSAEWLANLKAQMVEQDQADNIIVNNLLDAALKRSDQEFTNLETRWVAGLYAGNNVPKPGSADNFSTAILMQGNNSELLNQHKIMETRSKVSKAIESAPNAAEVLKQHSGRNLLDGKRVTLDEIRSKLQSDEYLVDIAAFRFFNYKAKPDEPIWQGRKYAAWVIPPAGKGDVVLIDLGDAKPIEAAVQRSLTAMNAAIGPQGTITVQGEPAAEKIVREECQPLANLILRPLLPHISKAGRLTVSPDGSLWLFPWEALPAGDNQFLGEKMAVRYLTSSRQMAMGGEFKSNQAPVVFANPDFDTASAAGPVSTGNGVSFNPAATRAVGKEAPLIPKVARLPGTALEATAIQPSLETYAGKAPTMILDREATETRLRTLAGPQTLVLATHGFVLDANKTRGRKAFDDDPLLRAGLLLAGCNRNVGQSDDGILTAREASRLNLLGTELVVLSACESGRGDVEEGEGVAGMRQAFHAAGAKAVVASSWEVPDRDTAIIMKDFFSNLAAGDSKFTALRKAQVKRIADRREKFGAAHPFFWAAWTLTGK